MASWNLGSTKNQKRAEGPRESADLHEPSHALASSVESKWYIATNHMGLWLRTAHRAHGFPWNSCLASGTALDCRIWWPENTLKQGIWVMWLT